MVFLAPPWESAACPVGMPLGNTTKQLWEAVNQQCVTDLLALRSTIAETRAVSLPAELSQ